MKEKERFIENIQTWENAPCAILERNPLLEAEGSEEESRFMVPVWVLDIENANGRTYTSALAERLVGDAPTTYALDGHPDWDVIDIKIGEVVAVGLNPEIRDGVLWAEARFTSPEFKAVVEAILEAGGHIGVSSVGYGWTDEDGVIIAEEFTLERYFDFVDNPANQIRITKETTSEEVEEETEVEEATAEPTGEATAEPQDSMDTSDDDYQFRLELERIRQIRREN